MCSNPSAIVGDERFINL